MDDNTPYVLPRGIRGLAQALKRDGDKLRLPDDEFTAWCEKLGGVSSDQREAVAFFIVALAAKLRRLAPDISGEAISQLGDLLRALAARPGDKVERGKRQKRAAKLVHEGAGAGGPLRAGLAPKPKKRR